MDQAPSSLAMDKKTPLRNQQNSRFQHTTDQHRDTYKKNNGNGNKRLQRSGGNGGGGGGGAGPVADGDYNGRKAGRSAWGRASNKYARNKEKESGQVTHADDASSEYGDDDQYLLQYERPLAPNARGGRGSKKGVVRLDLDSNIQSYRHGDQRYSRHGGANTGAVRRKSQYNSGVGGKGRGAGRDKLWHASCQFMVNEGIEAAAVATGRVPVGFTEVPATNPVGGSTMPTVGAPSTSLSDPDSKVVWDAVEEVVLHMTQPAHCPVCLYPPVAPQVTRCGHVYCFPCVLHYLSLTDDPGRPCPICYEYVEVKHLRSAVTVVHPDYEVGKTITLYLMKRADDSMLPTPMSSTGYHGFPHPTSPPPRMLLSRKIPATRQKVLDIIERERTALEVQFAEDSDAPESIFIQESLTLLDEKEKDKMALYINDTQSLDAAMEQLSLCKQSVGTLTEDEVNEATDVGLLGRKRSTASISSSLSDDYYIGSPDCLTVASVDEAHSDYSSPSSSPIPPPPPVAGAQSAVLQTDKDNSISVDSGTVCSSGGETSFGSSGNSSEEANLSKVEVDVPANGAPTVPSLPPLVETKDVEVLHFDFEGESSLLLTTADKQKPAAYKVTKEQPKGHYFYQAVDGSHVYLCSINFSMLVKEFGGVENCPSSITANVLEKKYCVMSDDLRCRTKPLRHLPLCCPYEIVELELYPSLVSEQTLSHYQSSLQKRQKYRHDRARAEAEIEKRNQALYEKEMSGRLFTRIQSAAREISHEVSPSNDQKVLELHFPQIGEHGSSAYQLPSGAADQEASTPNSTQPPSFAKMVRVNKNNRAAPWPTLGGGSGAPAGTMLPTSPLASSWGPGMCPKRVAPSSSHDNNAWGARPASSSAKEGGKLDNCADEQGDEDNFNAPDFSQTFSQAFDAMLQAAPGGQKGQKHKKGKKKQKATLLFKTGI